MYTIHLAQIERAAGAAVVMPVGDHDSTSYAELSTSLLQGHFNDGQGEQYEYFHTPGYPAFAAAIRFFTGGSFFAVTLAQILLAFATGLLTYVLGAQLLSPQAGRWASLLFLANPLVPYIVMIVGTDMLFTFLLTLAFVLLVKVFPTRPLAGAITAAVVFAAAVYVRPVGFIALPIFVAPLLAAAVPFKQKLLYGVGMLAIIAVLLLPWMLRNKADSGVLSFSSLFSLNMAYYEIPHYLSWHNNITIADGIQQVARESGVPEGIDANGYPANWYNLAYTPALDKYIYATVLAHPVQYAFFHLYNSTGFFLNPAINPPHQTANLKQLLTQHRFAEFARAAVTPWWLVLERVGIVIALLCIVVGFWSCRRKPLAWAFLFIILYFAALGGVSAASRLRLPVEPLLSLFIVAGLAVLQRKIWKRIH